MKRTRWGKAVIALIVGMVIAGLLDMLKGFDRPVRCSAGHLFTTIWIPLGSLKAIRLGRRRVQHCPVGHHWAMVVPLDRKLAASGDLAAAAAVHDVRIP